MRSPTRYLKAWSFWKFDVQFMEIWYKFVNNNVPTYFASMFRFNRELYDI